MISRDPLTRSAERRHLLGGGGRVNLTPAPSQQQTTSGAYHGGVITKKWEKRERNEKGDERVAVMTVPFYLVYITIRQIGLSSTSRCLS